MASVHKIKAEAFDILQYYYGTAHEQLIRCLIRFAGRVEESVLKKAVTWSQDALPLLRCCFDVTAGRPCWRDRGFTAEDIVRVIEAATDTADQTEKLLATTIDIAQEPPLRIFLVQEQNAASLCCIISHLVCDGAGFKEYLYLLSDLYEQCRNRPDFAPNLAPFPRSARQLFTNFSFFAKMKLLLARDRLGMTKNQLGYPLQGDNRNPFVVTRRLDKENFLTIKAYAKQRGITFNDVILTAYARVLHRTLGNNPIVLPCPVDLRKYLPSGHKHGICNLTGDFICKVTIGANEAFEDTLRKVSGQIRQQKSSPNCLKGVLLLELLVRVLPFRTVQKILSKVHVIPVISYTNLGIIAKDLLRFGDVAIGDAFITGAVKHVPYFQLAVSTYDDNCTLSCNLYGTVQDKLSIEHFLAQVKRELAVSDVPGDNS